MVPGAIRARALGVLLSAFCFCVLSVSRVPAQALNPEGFPTYPPGVVPDRIVLTWKDDPATSQAVTWRTDASVTRTVAEIMPAASTWYAEKNAVEVSGTSQPMQTREYGTVMHHSVNFTGLKPDTLYNYRVKGAAAKWDEWEKFRTWRKPADAGNWSEWFQFRTGVEKNKPFSFLFMGDEQTGIRSLWSRLVRAAVLYKPDVRFMVHAGDLISHADTDWQWGEWFAGGSWLFSSIGQAPVPGNHEYCPEEVPTYCKDVSVETQSVLSKNWLPQFTLPENGPEGSKELTYFFDYGDLRFISLNSAEVDLWPTPFRTPEREKEVRAEQKRRAIIHQKWLRETLTANPKRWNIVSFHHPIFPSQGFTEELITTYWQPVFEEFGVDLVLNGHFHNYIRGRNLPKGVKAYQGGCGTVYVVAMAGPSAVKPPDTHFEADIRFKGEQTYQVITIDGNQLRFEARNLTHQLMDGFTLVKRPGAGNSLIEEGPPRSGQR